MRRKLTAVTEHLQWLDGRMPSEARHDWDRETKNSPLGKFASTRTRSRRKKCKR